LACHYWKNLLMDIAGPSALAHVQPGQFVDVWDLIEGCLIPQYTPDVHQQYLSLFLPQLTARRPVWR
jgi:hypothetical protein